MPLLITLAAVIVILVGVSALAVLHAIRLQHRVDSVPAMLQAAEASAEDGRLGQAIDELVAAQQILGSVNTTLYNSLDFDLVNFLPVAHQNLAAIRRSVSLSLQLVGGGEQILHAASSLESPDGRLEVPLITGQVPLSVTERVQSAVASVVANLPLGPVPPHDALVVGKVQAAEARVYAESFKRRRQLVSVGQALSLIDDIAGAKGDRRYLIAVANSAEMRGTGGMYLAYGVISSHAGKVTLNHFGNTDEIALSQPETAVAFPSDFMRSYSGLGPSMNWREANIMSDYTVVAPVLQAMYRQATGLPVDGVIQVDPVGLSALLAGVGPVQTPDLGVVTSANVVPLTLNQAYFLYPNRTQRQDYTGEVAQAAFAQLLSGRFPSLRTLGTSLLNAGLQRHLLMYATDGADETTIKQFGMAGNLPGSSTPFTQLTVQNIGGDKLDYYLGSSLAMSGQKPSQVGSHLSATIHLANNAPANQTVPVELFGQNSPDIYQGLVTLYLPAGSALLSTQPDGSVTSGPVQSSQNGVCTITYTVSVPAGTQSQMVLNLFLPPSAQKGLEYITSPRVLPTVYTAKLR